MKVSHRKLGLLIIVILLIGSAFFFVPRKRSFYHYVRRAETAFQKKDFNRSIELNLKALKYYPKHERTPEILLMVGDTYNFFPRQY